MDAENKTIDIEKWPFQVPPNTGCVTTRQVMDRGFPVLAILHDKDGSWRVLCNTTEDPKDGLVVGLGDLYSKFPIMDKFVNIARGHEAVRESEDAEWEIFRTVFSGEE
jgi:hypothetical protein